jgi:hypothetical protein
LDSLDCGVELLSHLFIVVVQPHAGLLRDLPTVCHDMRNYSGLAGFEFHGALSGAAEFDEFFYGFGFHRCIRATPNKRVMDNEPTFFALPSLSI